MGDALFRDVKETENLTRNQLIARLSQGLSAKDKKELASCLVAVEKIRAYGSVAIGIVTALAALGTVLQHLLNK